jgi:hypothetical protein
MRHEISTLAWSGREELMRLMTDMQAAVEGVFARLPVH